MRLRWPPRRQEGSEEPDDWIYLTLRILPYAPPPALDWCLEAMAEFAERIFCFFDMQGPRGGSISKRMGKPDHLGAFLMSLS